MGAGCVTGRVVTPGGQDILGSIVTPSGVGYTLVDESTKGEVTNPLQPRYCAWVQPNAQVKLTATTASAQMGFTSGSIITTAGPGIPFQTDCTMVTDCIQVPDIVIGQNQNLADGGGTGACLPSPGDAGSGEGATPETQA